MKRNKFILVLSSVWSLASALPTSAQTTISISIADIISATGAAPNYDNGYLLPDGTRIKARSIQTGRGTIGTNHGKVALDGDYGGMLNGDADPNNTNPGRYALTLPEYNGVKDVNLFTRISSDDRNSIDLGMTQTTRFHDAIGFHVWANKDIAINQLLLVDCDGNPTNENQEWFTAFAYLNNQPVNPIVQRYNSNNSTDNLMTFLTTGSAYPISTNWKNVVNQSLALSNIPALADVQNKTLIHNNSRFSPESPNHYVDPDEIRIQGLFDFGNSKLNNFFVLWGITGNVPTNSGSQNSGVSPLVFNYEFDFGDAPASYGTVIDLQELVRPHSGPVHIVNPEKKVYLGNGVTKDEIAVASNNADADAQDDGLTLYTKLERNANQDTLFVDEYSISVKYHNEDPTATGYLIAYMDWNNNGIFDIEESSSLVTTNGRDGQVTITWNNVTVSNLKNSENTFLRLRYSSDPVIPITNPATNLTYYLWEYTPNGEIEDYIIPIDTSVTLPSDLLSFKAKAVSNGVEVDWAVTDQKSMKQYSLYKSIDGVKYNLLTSMASDNSILQHFNYFDALPNKGINIYQLRSEEFDGTVKVMGKNQIVYVNDNGQYTAIYPNPATNKVNITLSSTNHQPALYIYNSIGQLVRTNNLQLGGNEIDVSTFTRGTYIFELRDGTSVISTSKIILQ